MLVSPVATLSYSWDHSLCTFLCVQCLLLAYFWDSSIWDLGSFLLNSTHCINIPLFINSSIDGHLTFQVFWLLWINLLWIFFKQGFCGHVFISLAIKLLGHICLIFNKTTELSSKMIVPCYTPTSNYESSGCSIIISNIFHYQSFILALLTLVMLPAFKFILSKSVAIPLFAWYIIFHLCNFNPLYPNI